MTGPPAVARLVSPLVGPIRTVREVATDCDHAVLPAFAAETADLSQIHGCPVRSVSGSALHYDRGAAMAAAVGEAVERYCGAAVPDDLPAASAAELGARAVAPARFVLFHPDQHARPEFPYRPFLPSSMVRWTAGVDIETGAPAYLPAQLVYLGAEALEERGEVPIGYATSSGMACAPTAEAAILAGLLELVERDAVMLTWYLRRSPPRLRWRGNPRLAAVEERCFAPSGLRYVCLDLSEPLAIATVLAVVFGAEVGVAVGAASAASPEDAWMKAMREAFATYAWANRLRRRTPAIGQVELHRIHSFADHVRFYAEPGNLPLASFLWDDHRAGDHRAGDDRAGDDRAANDRADDARADGDRRIDELPRIEDSRPVHQIAAVYRKMRAAGASAYAVDLTTADIRRAGLSVWKVVSPELQPLDVGYGRRFLGGARRTAWADRLGARAGASLDALNPWPHPFP